MNPQDIQLVTDRGLPLLIATGIFCAVKLLRSQVAQSLLGMISKRLTWDAWPKPVAMGVLLASTGAGALATALIQGTPLSAALTTALVALIGAMGIDAAHGSIQEPASTNAQIRDAGSLKMPLPDVKTPVLVALLALGLLSQGCGQFQAHARQPAAGPMVAPQAIAVIQPSDAQCQAWLNTTEGLTIAQEILTACAGGTGISAAFPDTNAGREALGITSVVCGLLDLGAHVWMNLDNVKLDTYCQIQPAPVIP